MIVKHSKKFFKNYPSYAILISLLCLTIIGTILLALPISRTVSIPLIDLFFTSSSITTVTGLLTIPLDSFTIFGKCIILLLMQIGGLGLMTISLFFVYVFLDLGLYTQVLATEILSINSFKDTKRILLFMFKLTFIAESIGAFLTFVAIRSYYPWYKALGLSIFHSVSSFSNAGLSLFNEGIIQFNDNSLMMLITTALIAIGGLGFITWHELVRNFSPSHKHHKNISWHTKMVLKVYGISTLITCIIFWIIERNNTLATLTPWQTFTNILFLGISSKSTGFTPFSINELGVATVLILTAVMFIGSAPSSTGSGIKTSVFSIYLAVVKAAINGKPHAELQGRRLVTEQVYKAMAIIAISIFWIFFTAICLLITEKNWSFLDIFLESVSSFSNSGISTGMTPWLTSIGKFFISFSMIIGRIGALAVILGIKKLKPNSIVYPEEKVILG